MPFIDVPRYETPVREFVTNGAELLNPKGSCRKGERNVEFSSMAASTTSVDTTDITSRNWRREEREEGMFKGRRKYYIYLNSSYHPAVSSCHGSMDATAIFARR